MESRSRVEALREGLLSGSVPRWAVYLSTLIGDDPAACEAADLIQLEFFGAHGFLNHVFAFCGFPVGRILLERYCKRVGVEAASRLAHVFSDLPDAFSVLPEVGMPSEEAFSPVVLLILDLVGSDTEGLVACARELRDERLQPVVDPLH